MPMKTLLSRWRFELASPAVFSGDSNEDPCNVILRSSTRRSEYKVFIVCRIKTDEARYSGSPEEAPVNRRRVIGAYHKPSMLRVLGNGEGRATGGVYVNLTFGL